MIKKMNIIDKLHQQFAVEKIVSIDSKKHLNAPLIVELDTTQACDLACPGCVSEEFMASKNSFSSKRLMELGEEFKDMGVKGVILIGGGEPLAHTAIGRFMEYLGKNNIAIGITTNGTFIDNYIDTIAKYSFWTRVSIDAATDKTFNILRPSKSGKSKFNKIINNMRQLAKIKKGKLGFSFLVRTQIEDPNIISNIHEIYDAAVLARDIGCDYFEVKPSYSYKNNTIHSLVKHSKTDMDKAKEEIERLSQLHTDSFKIIKAITLDDSLNGAQKGQPKDYTYCPVSELRTLITPSGAYICPYWRGKKDFLIGDLKKYSMRDFWLSDMRKKVQNWVNPSKHCFFNCLRHESNLEILQMIEDFKLNKKIKIVKDFDPFI